MDTYTESQIRLFRPVILFHDQPSTPLCQSQRLPHSSSSSSSSSSPSSSSSVEHHKQRISSMLKTNSKIWTQLIQSTRQWNLPPILHSPPPLSIDTPYEPNIVISPTASSTSSFSSTSTITQPSSSSSFLPLSPPPCLIEEEEPVDYELHLDTLCLDKRRRGNLPKAVTSILKKWLLEHCRNPYPTEEEKLQLKHETQLTLNQISNWFINARRRTLPVILAKLNQHYPGIKARRRRRRQRQDKPKMDHSFGL